MINGTLASGLQGMQTGLRQTQSVAHNVANLNTHDGQNTVNLPEEMVNLMQADNQIAASAAVIATADKALSTLIENMS
ncbi:MAG: flagellar biosynthesis protein FlgE [Pseudomonadales bacterium]|nr:flagellar biosynthesis protein FlgE [Pseudomonadales bacterium]